jgi:hypothetical protein
MASIEVRKKQQWTVDRGPLTKTNQTLKFKRSSGGPSTVDQKTIDYEPPTLNKQALKSNLSGRGPWTVDCGLLTNNL